jgi:hypothetical protein
MAFSVIVDAANPAIMCSAAVVVAQVAGDLTGDGSRNRAELLRDSCGTFLSVKVAGRTLRLRVPAPDSRPSQLLLGGNLDGRGGDELLIERPNSGDTARATVVTVNDGRLRTLPAPIGSDLFVSGHGSGYGLGFGCVSPGLIEEISWGVTPPTWGSRELFRSDSARWVLVRKARVRITTGTFPSDVRQPFARCP